MSVEIFTLMSLCINSSDNKSYWIHRVDVKVSAQVTTVTYMHQSQPSLHSLRKHFTVHLELWPGNHLIWCNATYIINQCVGSFFSCSTYFCRRRHGLQRQRYVDAQHVRQTAGGDDRLGRVVSRESPSWIGVEDSRKYIDSLNRFIVI